MKVTKKNQWLAPNSNCIAEGHSVAKNLMFETRKDHKRFFKLWEKYLGQMTTITDYHLSPQGWVVMFKTRSTEEIEVAYFKQRSKSKKAKKKHRLREAKKMLSEHFRIFLSQYVRRMNSSLKRVGTLVLQSFRKYVVPSFIDQNKVFHLIRTKSLQTAQPLVKYQADEKEYDVRGEMKIDSIWKTSKGLYLGVDDRADDRAEVLGCMGLIELADSVLRNFVAKINYPNLPTPFS